MHVVKIHSRSALDPGKPLCWRHMPRSVNVVIATGDDEVTCENCLQILVDGAKQ